MSKKFISIISNLLVAGLLFSQSKAELDSRNGFKDIHLGDSFTTWSSNLDYLSDTKSGAKVYQMSKTKCSTYSVFDKSVSAILLVFDKEVLVQINIRTDYFQKPKTESGEYTKISFEEIHPTLLKFEELFGKPGYADKGEGDDIFVFIWAGDKVVLKIAYQSGPTSGSWLMIDVMNKTYLDNKTKGGF